MGTHFTSQFVTSKPILHIFLNPCKYQGQLQSLLVMRIPKQSLILKLTKILMKLYLYWPILMKLYSAHFSIFSMFFTISSSFHITHSIYQSNHTAFHSHKYIWHMTPDSSMLNVNISMLFNGLMSHLDYNLLLIFI